MRRRAPLVLVAVIACAVPVTGPAGASAPTPGPTAAAASSEVAAACPVRVRGTTREGRLHVREWTGRRSESITSARPTPFTARTWSLARVAGSGPVFPVESHVVTTARGAALYVFQRTSAGGTPKVTVDRSLIAPSGARAHLLAGDRVLTLDGRGRLQRRTFDQSGPRVSVGRPRPVGVRLRGVRDVDAVSVGTGRVAMYALAGNALRQVVLREGRRPVVRTIARGVRRFDDLASPVGCRPGRTQVVLYDRSAGRVVVRAHARATSPGQRLGPARRLPTPAGFRLTGLSR